MSKVTLSPIITDLRNRMGNVVFSKWKETNYVKQYSSHSRGNSERQLEIREAFAVVVAIWKNAGTTLHATWDAYAENLNMSGYNAFIKANISRVLEGAQMELFKSTGEDEPASLNAGTGAASGEIVCEFTLPGSGEQRHVIFFAQRIENNRAAGSISLYQAGPAPSSPFTITGLEAGAEYFVYAIVTNADYANAESVSVAACIRTVAGA